MNQFERMSKVLAIFCKNFKGTDIAIGGSLAMYVHGFDIEPHDLDIELENPDEATLTSLKTLSEITREQEGFNDSPYNSKVGHYRIMILGVYVDVWVVDKIDYERVVVFKDYKFGDVISVLRKKMKMQRTKDYKSLTDYLTQILLTQDTYAKRME